MANKSDGLVMANDGVNAGDDNEMANSLPIWNLGVTMKDGTVEDLAFHTKEGEVVAVAPSLTPPPNPPPRAALAALLRGILANNEK